MQKTRPNHLRLVREGETSPSSVTENDPVGVTTYLELRWNSTERVRAVCGRDPILREYRGVDRILMTYRDSELESALLACPPSDEDMCRSEYYHLSMLFLEAYRSTQL